MSESTIRKYEQLRGRDIKPVKTPEFLKSGVCRRMPGGEHVAEAINDMQVEAAGKIMQKLSSTLADDHGYWMDVDQKDEQCAESKKAKLRVTLLHHSLFANGQSETWDKKSLDAFLKRHFTSEHCTGDTAGNEYLISEILQEEAERLGLSK